MSALKWTRLSIAADRSSRTRTSWKRTEIISAYCHDIRQPLGAALLRAEALIEDVLETRQKLLVDEIHRNLQEIAQTSEAVFDAIRLSRSAIEPRVTNVDLGRLFKHLALVLDGPARAKGIRLRCATTDRIAETDEWLLTRLLQNLGANAVEFTTYGAVLLTCRRVANGLRFETRDSGPGLTENALRHLVDFDDTQEDSVSRGNTTGGLGLRNSCEFARLLGAELTVLSAPGKGTRFRLDLSCTTERRLSAKTLPNTVAPHRLTVAVLAESQDRANRIGKLFTRTGWQSAIFTNPMHFLATVTSPGFRPSVVVIPSQIGSISAKFLLRIILSRFEELKAVVISSEVEAISIPPPFERNVQIIRDDISIDDINHLKRKVSPHPS